MENQTNVQSVEAVKGLAFSGLYRIFISPVSFFNDLKQKPTVWLSTLVLAILLVVNFFIIKDVMLDMQISALAEQGQLEAAPDNMRQIMMITTLGGMIVYSFVGPLVLAGLAFLFGKILTDSKISFLSIWSVCIFGEILFVIGGLLISPMILAKGSVLNPLSLGFLGIEHGVESFMFTLFSKISLFHIWEIIVVGIGLSIFYEVPRNKGYILSVLSVGMVSIVHVLIAGVKSIM